MGRTDHTRGGLARAADHRVGRHILGVAGIVLFVGVWEVYCRTLGRDFDSIASPFEAVGAIRELISDGLGAQVVHTLRVTLVGWLLAIGLGGGLGLVVGLWSLARTSLLASIEVLRAIPSIAFIPVALMLFGFSARMELAIIVYVSQWPILMGVIGGIKSVKAGLVEVGQTFRLTRRDQVLKIVVPAALPSIIVGLRLALTLCLAMAVVAEMLGNPAGLGYGMVFAQMAVQPSQVFAYLIVIGLLGWLLNVLFVALVRKTAPGFRGAV